MGSTLQLNGQGDLVITPRQQLGTISSLEKIRQDLEVITRSAVGSLATDPQFGTDILTLTESCGDTSLIASAVTAAYLQHPQIASVGTVSISISGRMAQISVTATLENGVEITVEVTT